MSRRTHGFTLIELLVVIGIIALLIAMLLPALSKAKQQAQLVKCLSQVQQHVTATMVFTLDHRDQLPWPNWDGGSPAVTDEPGWLYDPRVGGVASWSIRDGSLYTYMQVEQLWRCPMDDAPDNAVGVRRITSYVMNGAVSSYSPGTPHRISGFDSSDVLYWELDEDGGAGSWNDGSNYPYEYITSRHDLGGRGGPIRRRGGASESGRLV
jgi:prepilin-type N-terminal cleavage/methylation domain-containing protein